MVASCHERILAAVATALAAVIAGVPGLEIDRERDETSPIQSDELPRLVVYEAGDPKTIIFTGQDDFNLTVQIEGYCSGANGLAAAQAASDLRARAMAAIGNTLQVEDQFFAVEHTEEPGLDRASIDCEDPFRGFVLSFVVPYATAEGDPFTFA